MGQTEGEFCWWNEANFLLNTNILFLETLHFKETRKAEIIKGEFKLLRARSLRWGKECEVWNTEVN